jgi:predicted TIM-barrel fold metal-dependent hydrolase
VVDVGQPHRIPSLPEGSAGRNVGAAYPADHGHDLGACLPRPFERNPTLRVAAIENSSVWVPWLLSRFDRVYGQMPQTFKQHPRESFIEHVFVAPEYEDDIDRLAEYLPANRILFGSDYPHPEGLDEPLDYLKEFSNFSDADVKLIFHDNLKGLLEGVRN